MRIPDMRYSPKNANAGGVVYGGSAPDNLTTLPPRGLAPLWPLASRVRAAGQVGRLPAVAADQHTLDEPAGRLAWLC